MLLQNLLQDVHYALRQLRKSPGFVALAVGTLALGIAANSTIASWIRSTLFNPIPGAAQTGQMLTIMRGDRSEHPGPPFSFPDFVDIRDQATTFSGMLGYHDDFMYITGAGKPERIYGAATSTSYFEVLGIRPLLGRTLLTPGQDERAEAAEAVLSYSLWQNRFAGDPAIIGKTIEINLYTYTIVGVAPNGFQGCKSGLRTDIWLPLGMERRIWSSNRLLNRGAAWLNVLGVLRPGVDHRQAENELNLLMQRIVDLYPIEHQGANQISTDPLWRSPFGANVYLSGTLPILLALAAVLLLLACANVANLLLVRSVTRRREFAIRLSMGASRWRLVRQLMIENLIIALAGGAVALIGTVWTARTLATFLPPTTLPLAIKGSLDSTVMLATILVSILTAVVSGIVPALRASALSPITVLKDEALNTSGGLHRSRLAGGLVVAQVALSLLLLTCAGLLVRSLDNAQKSNPGFDPDHVLVASFDLSPLGYTDKTGAEFQRQLLARAQRLPGVQSAAIGDFSPLSFTIHSSGVLPEGYVRRPHETVEVDRGSVSPGYLTTLRTPFLAGRDFTDQDNEATQPVAIVNQAFADRYWPGQNALGKKIELWPGHWITVVGIAANGKYRRLVMEPEPLVLFPMYQNFEGDAILHVRATGDPQALASAVERTVADLNPNLPLFNVTTLKSSMGMGSVFQRIAAVFAGAFGLLALILAVVGIYGVVSYTARQRTHEIGIRMALGAARGDVFRQILRQGLRLTLIGLAVGLAVSLAFTRLLRGLLFGVGTADWVTFATVSIALCVVALVACYIPARRAASIEPMQALRSE
jgi:predicted permease